MFYVIKWTVPETVDLGIQAILPAFVAGGLAISATNGGIGIYPFSVALVLNAFSISNESGLAFGWIMWTSQTLMIIIFGSLSFFVLPLVNRQK
ncbi:MAG: TIGR00374 family protein, partial [Flavobacteriaceae bacterium]